MKRIILISILLVGTVWSQVTFSVDVENVKGNISPYIYGVNNFNYIEDAGVTFQRFGGNRLTGYNWEENASSAGSDWQHSSDGYLGGDDVVGAAWTNFVDTANINNLKSIVTLQMAGYVSADKDGTVDSVDTAPSARWKEVKFQKGSAFTTTPDLTDDYVYMDEGVNFLIEKYGLSKDGGVMGYALDNEPVLWDDTHPRIHPDPVTFVEYRDKSIALSKAVKDVDANAEIYGGVLFGWSAFTDGSWGDLDGEWFIDAYLKAMKQAEEDDGRRLLDVLDLHWYPEAQGDGKRIVFDGGTGDGSNEARIQAPRSLWDPDYKEDSWIAEWQTKGPIALLPMINEKIETNYPGTKLSFTEWDFGETSHWSSGLAASDALGIFGEYNVYATTYWGDLGAYGQAAYKIYGNYDGSGAKYGDVAIEASTSDKDATSIHAAISTKDDTKLHIMAINKRDVTVDATINLNGNQTWSDAEVWGFDSLSAEISKKESVANISLNSFTYSLPARSVMHMIVSASVGTTDKINSFNNGLYQNQISINANSFTIPVVKSGELNLKIMNLQGKTIQSVSVNVNNVENWQYNVNANEYANGVYLISVSGNALNEQLVAKWVN